MRSLQPGAQWCRQGECSTGQQAGPIRQLQPPPGSLACACQRGEARASATAACCRALCGPQQASLPLPTLLRFAFQAPTPQVPPAPSKAQHDPTLTAPTAAEPPPSRPDAPAGSASPPRPAAPTKQPSLPRPPDLPPSEEQPPPEAPAQGGGASEPPAAAPQPEPSVASPEPEASLQAQGAVPEPAALDGGAAAGDDCPDAAAAEESVAAEAATLAPAGAHAWRKSAWVVDVVLSSPSGGVCAAWRCCMAAVMMRRYVIMPN